MSSYLRASKATRLTRRIGYPWQSPLASLTLGLLTTATCAGAESIAEPHLSGAVRSYYFDRRYADATTPDASATGTALLLNGSAPIASSAFSAAASVALANAAGTHSSNPRKVDATLMGPSNALTSLTQAYIDFRSTALHVRVGDQYLNTPWMAADDSRLVPASFRAVNIELHPRDFLTLYLIRSTRWKSRTSEHFYADNLYYPSHYEGDPIFGGNGSLSSHAPSYSGTWIAGAAVMRPGFQGEFWFYNFSRFAQMTYAQARWVLPGIGAWTPSIAAQYVAESGGGDNILVESQTKVVGVAGARVRSRASGLDIGMQHAATRFDLSWNRINHESGDVVGRGALISPFTVTYASDPLYTTSMLRGLVEQGPGQAWKAKATRFFFERTLEVTASYAVYSAQLRGRSDNFYVDAKYSFRGALAGLRVRNRWERSTGGSGNLNPGGKAYSFDRVMLSYEF